MSDIEIIKSEKELTEHEAALRNVRDDYESTYGFHDDDVKYSYVSEKGLDAKTVRGISEMKGEPEWMTEIRLQAYEHFVQRPMPDWGGTELLNQIDFDDIYYYVRATDRTERDWDDVPPEIKDTFDRLGIPEAEAKYLQGVSAQYDSESVYHNIQKDLESKGVIFLDMDSGLREYPELVRE
jgi:Fe-S cluster assembly protein SufB